MTCQPLKILVFYQYFGTPKGSWSTRYYELTRRWVKDGHKVTIVSSVYDKSDIKANSLIDKQCIEGVEVITLNIGLSNKHGFFRRILSFFLFAFLSSWYAITKPCDVTIASSGPITVGIPGLIARYLRGRKLVFEVRDLWPEGAVQLGILKNQFLIFLAYSFEKWCYRAASQVITLSPGMQSWLNNQYRVDSEVISNGSDTDLIQSLKPLEMPPWAKGKKLLVYTGTLGLIDDVGQLVDWALWIQDSRPEMMIVVIGDGKEKERIVERARVAELKNIHFTGLLPKHEVFRWLKIAYASIFVVKETPFLNTASPNKVFDAFAAGIPVIQTTTGWIKPLVSESRCGVNLEPQDPTSLLSALDSLDRDYDLYCQGSRELGEGQFNRDSLARNYLGILQRVNKTKIGPKES